MDEKYAENNNVLDFDVPVDTTQNIIKVIGVGGGGCNAVKNMYREGINSVTFAALNTDSKSLIKCNVPVKMQLGHTGLGAGANPDRGRKEAEETIEEIRHLLDDGTKMAFITAGMGGGTGTGAAPLVANIAKSMGILTIGIVTLPFYFEKRRKIVKALRGLEEMRNSVDALLVINNEQISKIYSDSHITIDEAFANADKILSNAVRSISELITVDGKIATDFRDVETTMKGGGGAIMAMGRASGEYRVQNAILDALKSPLLHGSDISKASRILFNIYSSPEYPIYVDEMEQIDAFFDELDNNIDVIWGISDDPTLDEDVKVTILATGFENTLWENKRLATLLDDEEGIDEVMEMLYGRNRKGQVTYTPDDNVIHWTVTDEQSEEPESLDDQDTPVSVGAPDTTQPPEPSTSFLNRVIGRIKKTMEILTDPEEYENGRERQ